MEQLKKGDWVVYEIQDDPLGTVKTIKEEGFIEINIGKNTLSVPSEYLKLWKPKEGEWCWFWGNYDNNRTLAQLKNKTVGNFYHTIEDDRCKKDRMLDNYYDYCEPFIGTLPTGLKK
jgi:hypothetical protein